jgi:hypothetical protein
MACFKIKTRHIDRFSQLFTCFISLNPLTAKVNFLVVSYAAGFFTPVMVVVLKI